MTDLARLIMTNDDGIDSPGLLLFAKELAKEFDVVVAAPRPTCLVQVPASAASTRRPASS